jgi:hypothetical protein
MVYLLWSSISLSEIFNVWISAMNAKITVITFKKYKQNQDSLYSSNFKFKEHKFKTFT